MSTVVDISDPRLKSASILSRKTSTNPGYMIAIATMVLEGLVYTMIGEDASLTALHRN